MGCVLCRWELPLGADHADIALSCGAVGISGRPSLERTSTCSTLLREETKPRPRYAAFACDVQALVKGHRQKKIPAGVKPWVASGLPATLHVLISPWIQDEAEQSADAHLECCDVSGL